MKQLIIIMVFLFTYSGTMAQSAKIFIDNKLSTTEEANKISSSQIESMSNSVEDGVVVTRIILKKGAAKSTDKPTQIGASNNISAALKKIYESSTLLKAGDVAANFTSQRYSGEELQLEQYRGKVVLLNFWATWCVPCLKELAPDGLPVVLEKFKNNPDFVFIPVAYTDTKDKLDAFFATQNGKTIYNYLSLITLPDPDKEIFSLYAKSGVPRSFVIGKDGRIVMGSLGAQAEELRKIEDSIETALKE